MIIQLKETLRQNAAEGLETIIEDLGIYVCFCASGGWDAQGDGRVVKLTEEASNPKRLSQHPKIAGKTELWDP